MNTPTQPRTPEEKQREDRMMKIFAIIGFVVLIIVVAWLAIQAVRIIPGAFSSLASLADHLNDPEKERTLDVAVSTAVPNSNAPIEVAWTDLEADGAYTLRYDCVDGVALTILENGESTPLGCGETHTFSSGIYEAELTFASERMRFADVTYIIAFVPEDDDADAIEVTKTVTIVNTDIPLADGSDDETEDEEVDDEVAETPEETPADETPDTPTTPTGYRYVEVKTYEVPVSDPNGYAELEVSFLSVGTMNGARFSPGSELEAGEKGAFRFKVENTGTKTSDEWTFDAKLPSGEIFESKSQEELAPKESALITIAFNSAGEDGISEIEVEIEGGNDRDEDNNEFSHSVRVD